MNRVFYIVCFFVMHTVLSLEGQTDTVGVDASQLVDSTIAQQDGVERSDTTRINDATTGARYKPRFTISPDAIPVKVQYGSVDSTRFRIQDKSIELWGDAYLKYQSYDLKAGYIRIDFENKEAIARDIIDSSGLSRLEPVFTDGSNNVRSKNLRFNFDTKKAFSRSARFQEGGFYIYGDKTKFVPGSEATDPDSMTIAEKVEDMIFQEDCRITTCNHDHPHFHIQTRRIKIIKDKLAVIGFSQLKIANIPTPIFLPFGLFPLVNGESSGLIFPRSYEYEDELGFGLRGIGYYFPINNKMNLTVLGDIYTRGTHRINVSTNFKKRYKYSGNAMVEYANNIAENNEGKIESQKSYQLRVRLDQDRKAHPYRSFGGNIHIETRQHSQRNYNDFDSKYNNILRSGLTYSNSMPWSPFSFSLGLSHTQNIATNDFRVTLPDMSLNMRRIHPFQNKERISAKEPWYDKIWVGYKSDFKNNLATKDTLLFTEEALDAMTIGLNQRGQAGANFKILKYVDVSPSVTYDNILFSKKNNRFLDLENPVVDTSETTINAVGDTLYLLDTSYVVKDNFKWGIYDYHRFDARISASTKIFGMLPFGNGWLRAIRHTMTPNVSLSYTSPTDQYYDVVYDSPYEDDRKEIRYNPYQGSGYSFNAAEEQLGINYSLGNVFEGKHRGKDGEKDKKFYIFQRLNFSGSYNFAADSLKWRPLSFNGNTDLIKGVSSLRINGRFGFYERQDGRYINRTVWDRKNLPFQFEYTDITLSTSFSVRQIQELFSSKKQDRTSSKKNSVRKRQIEENKSLRKKRYSHPSLMEYIENFRVRHSYRLRYELLEDGRDSLFTANHYIELSTNGQIPLTKNWRLSIDNLSYDIKRRRVVYPSFGLSRDLHCWEMDFRWQPSSAVYSFFIGVKSSNLSFIKYNHGQRNVPSLLGR